VLDEASRIAARECAANDTPIRESERLLRWADGPRPTDHAGLAELHL
jgi:nuclear transport factor 2 (NTF2) superfamily protein